MTHALACCLNEDSKLLKQFVEWVAGTRGTRHSKLQIVEQRVPGQPASDSDDETKLGLPDLWIHDHANEEWSLIVESKITAPVKADQLRRHAITARRNGFFDATLLVLSPKKPARIPTDVKHRTWTELYRWMRKSAPKSEWARRFVEYIEIAEERMTADGYLRDGSLTEFDGIPFDDAHPYSYREARRILQLLMKELRQSKPLRKLGVSARGQGRAAITGRKGTSVWDFLPLRSSSDQHLFTFHPHLTISIGERRLVTAVIVANGISGCYRRNLTDLGIDRFRALVGNVGHGVTRAIAHCSHAYPWMEVVQRRYASQRSKPTIDARLEFDLRTAAARSKSKIKAQPEWLEAAYYALSMKRSNLQLAIGAAMPYGDSALQSRKVVDTIANIWIACDPWLRQVLHGD